MYKLRKAPRRELYWVVAEDGTKKSKEPMPRAKAEAQLRALYAAMGRSGGAVNRPFPDDLINLTDEDIAQQIIDDEEMARWVAERNRLRLEAGLPAFGIRAREIKRQPPPPPPPPPSADKSASAAGRYRGGNIYGIPDEYEEAAPSLVKFVSKGGWNTDWNHIILSPEIQDLIAYLFNRGRPNSMDEFGVSDVMDILKGKHGEKLMKDGKRFTHGEYLKMAKPGEGIRTHGRGLKPSKPRSRRTMTKIDGSEWEEVFKSELKPNMKVERRTGISGDTYYMVRVKPPTMRSATVAPAPAPAAPPAETRSYKKEPMTPMVKAQIEATREASGKGYSGGVSIPKAEFIKEHKHLLGVLKKGKRSALSKEAESQSAELSKVLKGGATNIELASRVRDFVFGGWKKTSYDRLDAELRDYIAKVCNAVASEAAGEGVSYTPAQWNDYWHSNGRNTMLNYLKEFIYSGREKYDPTGVRGLGKGGISPELQQQREMAMVDRERQRAINAQAEGETLEQMSGGCYSCHGGLIKRMNKMLPKLFGGMKERFEEDIDDIAKSYGSSLSIKTRKGVITGSGRTKGEAVMNAYLSEV